MMDHYGTGAGMIIDEDFVRVLFKEENELINGGWEPYMFDPEHTWERDLNAEIETKDDAFSQNSKLEIFFIDGNN